MELNKTFAELTNDDLLRMATNDVYPLGKSETLLQVKQLIEEMKQHINIPFGLPDTAEHLISERNEYQKHGWNQALESLKEKLNL